MDDKRGRSAACCRFRSFGYRHVRSSGRRNVSAGQRNLGNRAGHDPGRRYWYEDQPPEMSTAGIDAPEGLLVPAGGFGAVWLSIPQARSTLGYATTLEQPVAVNIQRFDGGSLFLDESLGQVFALMVTGIAYGPFSP
jgi:hypothetical protein